MNTLLLSVVVFFAHAVWSDFKTTQADVTVLKTDTAVLRSEIASLKVHPNP